MLQVVCSSSSWLCSKVREFYLKGTNPDNRSEHVEPLLKILLRYKINGSIKKAQSHCIYVDSQVCLSPRARRPGIENHPKVNPKLLEIKLI